MSGTYAHLELDDDDALDHAISTSDGEKETPRYPWGTRFCLTEVEMAKAGMTEPPDKGDILHFSAFAEVTSVTHTDDDGGKRCRVELQITHILKMESETDEM